MIDGNYYMDSEEFIHVTGHFIGGEDTSMVGEFEPRIRQIQYMDVGDFVYNIH